MRGPDRSGAPSTAQLAPIGGMSLSLACYWHNNFADKIIDHAEPGFLSSRSSRGAPRFLFFFVLQPLGSFALVCASTLSLFPRRLFPRSPSPRIFCSGYARYGRRDTDLSARACRRFALWPGEFCHMRNVSAQVFVPAAMFSAARFAFNAGYPRRERAGHAVIHDAGSGHRLACRFGTAVSCGSVLTVDQAVLPPG